MARKVRLIEDENSELVVNTYTIQYDTKTKRFFKAYTPKVGSGAAVATGVFAGLGALTLLTGGLFGLGTIAGISVASGALVPTISNLAINAINDDKMPRFNTMIENGDIGGYEDVVTKEKDGVIGIVEDREKKAYKYRQLLKIYPTRKEFPLNEDEDEIKIYSRSDLQQNQREIKIYSRRDLQRKAKRCEEIAYSGLKSILDHGMSNTEQINALSKQTNLTKKQTADLEKYWNEMDRIVACVKNITSKRVDFNPYKDLIIRYIQKGCLLGEIDSQNNQIKAVATNNSREKAAKLYSNMYELPLLNRIKHEREVNLEMKQQINEENKRVIKTRKQLIKHDGDIRKVDAANQSLATEMNVLAGYHALVLEATSIEKLVPATLATEKTQLSNAIAGLKTAVESNNIDQMIENENILTMVIDDVAQKLITISANQKVKELAQKQINAYKKVLLKQKAQIGKLEDAVDIAQATAYETNQQLNKTQAKYEASVKRGVNKNAEAKYWRDRAESAEATVEGVYGSLVETEQQLNKANAKYESSVKRGIKKRTENKYWKNRAESAENAVNGIYDTLTETEDEVNKLETELDKATQGWYEAEQRAEKQTKKYQSSVKRGIKKNAEAKYWRDRAENAEATVEGVYETFTATEQQLDSTTKKLEKTEQTAKRNAASKKRLAGKLLEETNKRKQAEDKLAETEQELNDTVNTYTIAQGENIQRIIDLEVDNENLKQQNAENFTLAENLAYDLHKTQKELEQLEAYKQGVNELEEELRLRQEVIDSYEELIAKFMSAQETRDYRRDMGSATRILINLLNKVEAHVEYTKELEDGMFDDSAVKYMESMIMTIRSKHASEMTFDDIKLFTKVLRSTYGVQSKKMRKVSAKKLRDLVQEHKKAHGNGDVFNK